MEPPAKVIFVLGGPGAGKGTQCGLLANSGNFIHLSAGELLRAERSKGSCNGDLIEQCIVEGKIVPAEITVALLRQAMTEGGWNSRPFLIDGFPRNAENYDAWFRLMADVEVHSLIHIVVSDEVLFQRIQGRNESRTDDNPESLRKRLTTYHEQTLRILENFETHGKLKAVEGDASIEEVHRRVLEAFN
jgi:UMP-CMP kinase family protein